MISLFEAVPQYYNPQYYVPPQPQMIPVQQTLPVQQITPAPAQRIIRTSMPQSVPVTPQAIQRPQYVSNIAGTPVPVQPLPVQKVVQPAPVQKVVQQQPPAVLKQPAGVPVKLSNTPAAIKEIPKENIPVKSSTAIKENIPVKKVEDFSGTEAAGIAIKKGAKAAGKEVGSIAQKAVEVAGEHPVATAAAAGVTGGLGLKRLLRKNNT